MPFFRLRRREKKTEESLKRTKQGFFRRIVGVFNTPKIDEEFWENLEETLISADVGVKTSTRISEVLRERVKMREAGQSGRYPGCAARRDGGDPVQGRRRPRVSILR